MKEQNDTKKITAGLVFSWIFGVLFIFGALGSFANKEALVGVLFLVMGASILPPVNNALKSKWHIELSTGLKWIIIIVCFIIIAFNIPQPAVNTISPPKVPQQEATPTPTAVTPPPTTQVAPQKALVRSASLSIDKATTTTANLAPIRVIVNNIGDVAISPKFDVTVTDRIGTEVCSGSPMFDEFSTVSPGNKKTGEFSILGCIFKEDGTYAVKVDLLDSDYTKLDSATKDVTVTYWSAFK